MKKILFLVLFLILTYSTSFGQKKFEGTDLVEHVSKIIGQHITFIGYEEKKDSIRVHEINYYDFNKKIYIKLNESEIKKKYPNLLNWFTIKINLPLGRANGANVNNFNNINTVNFRDRA